MLAGAEEKPGRVKFVRLAAPEFVQVEAVSVILEERKSEPRYAGTMYPASDVRRILQ